MSPVQAIGKYYDGMTGKPHEVMVGLSGSSLRITCSDGTFEKNWSYNEIEVLEDALPPQPAKLTSKKEPEARLFINPDHGWLRIRDKLPASAFPKIALPVSWRAFIGYFGLSVALIVFVVFVAPRLFENAGYLIPKSLEKKLGNHIVHTIITDPVCVAPEGVDALHSIVKRLEAGLKKDPHLKIHIVDNTKILNALAVPGGQLVVFSGVIKQAKTPEEIAGVLAHEMGHIALDHPIRSLARNMGISLILGMITGSEDMARIAGTLTSMRYSREDEHAADRKGRELLAKAGINPKSMALFFQHLVEERQEHKDNQELLPAALSYFSTHPQTEERIREALADTQEPQKPDLLLSPEQFQALKNTCSETSKL